MDSTLRFASWDNKQRDKRRERDSCLLCRQAKLFQRWKLCNCMDHDRNLPIDWRFITEIKFRGYSTSSFHFCSTERQELRTWLAVFPLQNPRSRFTGLNRRVFISTMLLHDATRFTHRKFTPAKILTRSLFIHEKKFADAVVSLLLTNVCDYHPRYISTLLRN